MPSRFLRHASIASLSLFLAISAASQQSAQQSTHARALELVHQSMNALGGEEKLRAIHAIEIKGVGVIN